MFPRNLLMKKVKTFDNLIKILNPDERDPVVAAISHLYNDICVDVKAVGGLFEEGCFKE